MKNICSIIFVLLLITACKDNPTVKKMKQAKDGVVNTKNVIKESTYMQDDIKNLSEMTPLTNEELKSWLPENVDGMKRTSFKAGEMGMMNIASIEATYTAEDKSRTFKIEVIDGAGEMALFLLQVCEWSLLRILKKKPKTKQENQLLKKAQKPLSNTTKEEINLLSNSCRISVFISKHLCRIS